MRFGSEDLKMLFSRSIALLVAVTFPDHFREEDFWVPLFDFFGEEDFVFEVLLVERDVVAIFFTNTRTRMIPDHGVSSINQSIWQKTLSSQPEANRNNMRH